MSTNTWATTKQESTLEGAVNSGESWTIEDVEFVSTFTEDATDEELALTLGRSLYAIWSLQHRVRAEGFQGVVESIERADLMRRRASRVEVGYDFVTTFPEGWND